MIGIYKITNLVNGKFYIGSTKCYKSRKAAHLYNLRRNKHGNFHLQNSFNKYGEENFKFEVLEKCELNKLIIREQYWIDTLKPEYNIRQYCESNLGFKHSQKTKDKISKASKKLWKTNSKLLSESKWKPILAYDKNGNFIKEYKSVKEAAKELNLAGTNISTVLKGNSISAKGLHFIYKTDKFTENINIPKRKNNGTVGISNRQKVELWLNDSLIKKFNSKTELGKYLNINRSMISMIMSGEYFTKHPKTKIPKYQIKEL